MAAALFAATRGLAACGGSSPGESEKPSPTPAPRPSPTPTATPAPSPTPTPPSPSPSPTPSPTPTPTPTPPPGPVAFPLAISANRRHLVDANGQPFLIHGDTPWSLEVQCTHAQIDTYLNDRQAKGFNAILFECFEHYFSSQTPPWRNAQSGVNPFTTMTDFTKPNETYWQTVDYIVNGAKARGIVCFITHTYLGFGGGSGAAGDQGWDGEVRAAANASLQTFGAFLANRYRQGNIVWVAGGDYNPPDPAKQWNIHSGIRSVRTTDLMTGHGGRNTEAWTVWNGQPGFNLNNIYCGGDGISHDDAAAAYARSGPVPFFLIEGAYGNAQTDAQCRLQAYQALLSGACGHFFGTFPLWGFGEPNANGGIGAAAALRDYLGTPVTLQMGHVKALFTAYPWQLLVPRTDASLVTSGLGSGASRICPARASDGSFAMVWVPGTGGITVNMSALAPANVRARWYRATTGTYAAVGTFANTGTRSFAPPGAESVLVLDAG
jgi:hypothetical protein